MSIDGELLIRAYKTSLVSAQRLGHTEHAKEIARRLDALLKQQEKPNDS